jgi:hypothetical protein
MEAKIVAVTLLTIVIIWDFIICSEIKHAQWKMVRVRAGRRKMGIGKSGSSTTFSTKLL